MRSLLHAAFVAGVALLAGCADRHIGEACAVGDACADGYECVAYCGSRGAEGICTPRLGSARLPEDGVVDALSITGRDDAVQFAAVREVKGNLVVDLTDSDLSGLSLPLLTHVEKDLQVLHGDKLECLELPSLTDVGGVVTIDENASLTAVSAVLLESAGGLLLTGNASLSAFQATVLERARGDVEITGNPFLATLNLQKLATVDGDVHVGGNTRLKKLELDGLSCVSGAVTISDASGECPALPSLARACEDVDERGASACVTTCPAAAACP